MTRCFIILVISILIISCVTVDTRSDRPEWRKRFPDAWKTY